MSTVFTAVSPRLVKRATRTEQVLHSMLNEQVNNKNKGNERVTLQGLAEPLESVIEFIIT